MNSLVTGGAGFIGSHLCDFLLARGHSVICVDNLITGRMDNIQHLLSNRDFLFKQHDISEPYDADTRVDYVFHFASPASPVDFPRIPIEIMKAGSLGTFNALAIARKHGARFLLASTSEVYGDPSQNPQREDYWGNVNPVGPRSVYDESKRFAEALTMANQRKFGLETRIVRIFNTYGPRMRKDDGRVIPSFVTQALEGKPLTVFGDGTQTRSLCYVPDLLDGIYRLAISDVKTPVNIGNPEEVTMADLAARIIRATGSASQVKFLPLPQDEPKLRRPDITKAQELLGWQPKISLKDGLGKTIQWFRSGK